jgi:ammonia channel protein AmtB
LLAGNPHQVVVQLLAIGVTMALAGSVTAVVLVAIKAAGQLRVPIPDEIRSVDLGEHGEEAYSGGDDVGALAGRAVALGESVLIPVADVRRAAGG